MLAQTLLGALVLCGYIYASTASKLSFRIESRMKECLHEVIGESAAKEIDFEYEVVEGGSFDIGMTVIDPTNYKVFQKFLSFDERFGGVNSAQRVKLDDLRPGTYQICFDNVDASRDSKVVILYTKDEEDKAALNANDDKFAEHSEIESLTKTAQNIKRELEKVQQLQLYTQKRLHRHLWTQESTSSRKDFMTMLQFCVIAVVVVLQTVSIKQWFGTRRTSFRV